MGQMYFVESNLTGYGAIVLQLAKERGLQTHFVARDPCEYTKLEPNPIELADTLSVVDTYDVPKLLHFFADKKPLGVIAFDDYRLIPTAIVGSQLGLPHTDVGGLVNTHFKDRTRACTRGIGGSVQAVTVALDEPGQPCPLDYPCVVKPIDDSGSTGVRICHSDEDYREALDRIRTRPVNARSYRVAPIALVEEFIDGEEFTAEVMWDTDHGRWRLIGFTKKLMAEPPFRVELGAMFPYSFGPEIDALVEQTVYDWVAATGHRRGAAHVEFKVPDGVPTLMEINPRLGGDQIRELMLRTRGVDSIDLYLRLQLGERATLGPRQIDRGYATILYLTPPRPGVIERVEPPDRPHAGVVRSALLKSRFEARDVTDNDDRLGYVITQADDFDLSYRQAQEFMSHARIVWAEDDRASAPSDAAAPLASVRA